MRRPPLSTDALLVIDRTGVGVAVMDMFTEAWRDGRLAGITRPVGVTITGGDHGTDYNVPKSDLMGAVQATLQAGTLRIAPGPLVPVLQKELLAFRQKISATGRTTYDAPAARARATATSSWHSHSPWSYPTPCASPT